MAVNAAKDGARQGGVFLLTPCACCPVLPCCPYLYENLVALTGVELVNTGSSMLPPVPTWNLAGLLVGP
jgi:hypothetical protein